MNVLRVLGFPYTMKDPKSIYIGLVAGLGDLVLAAPTIAALKKKFPKANLCLGIGPEAFYDIIANDPNIDEFDTSLFYYPPTKNIRKFHIGQKVVEAPVKVEPGVFCWRESRAISSVGLYVPGGNAVFPSTVLMLGIPAQMAGCKRVVLCVPPMKNGLASPEVLVAAAMTGITEVFKIGGAQAIAALANGTETVPRVDKILGPGNRWVQGAKLLAMINGVAIDMVAGPTEVLVIADHSAVPEWVASDLVAQADAHYGYTPDEPFGCCDAVIEVDRIAWARR
mgnify:CR=1 FL=1